MQACRSQTVCSKLALEQCRRQSVSGSAAQLAEVSVRGPHVHWLRPSHPRPCNKEHAKSRLGMCQCTDVSRRRECSSSGALPSPLPWCGHCPAHWWASDTAEQLWLSAAVAIRQVAQGASSRGGRRAQPVAHSVARKGGRAIGASAVPRRLSSSCASLRDGVCAPCLDPSPYPFWATWAQSSQRLGASPLCATSFPRSMGASTRSVLHTDRLVSCPKAH